jgi:ribonuclease/clavin/mitogillin
VLPICEVPRLAILWGQRGHDAPALPGFHAPAGGGVDERDASAPNDGGEDAPARVAALRELFEELGILWAHGAEALDERTRQELRWRFHESADEGHGRLAALGLAWRTAELVPIGRWVSPSYVPRRAHVSYFALRLPARIAPDADLFEHEEAEWIEPERALEKWQRGEVLIQPPLAAFLRSFARGALRQDELLAVFGARGEDSLRWECVPWVQVLPLRTPTLPPATHTNSLLIGSGQALLVEPATPYPEELDRMVQWVEEGKRAGIEPIAIFATHHHVDHIGGARALAARLSLPIWGHRITGERGKLALDRHLEDGERIELEGPERVVLRMIHTPGHAPGHLCVMEERSRVMIAGDMVAGEGTILIEPNDGDMAEYLASLRRMAGEEPSMLLPAHGMALRDPQWTLDHYVAHRLAREAKVLDALVAHGSPASAAELLPRAYDDAPRAVWPIAALSAEAHLIKLEREGRARRVADRWSAV